MPRMRATAILASLPYVIKRLDEDRLYRYYVTDSLYYMRRNNMLSNRFYDIVNKRTQEQDDRTGDEIAADIINRMGLECHESI